jgi:hypothetical protein
MADNELKNVLIGSGSDLIEVRPRNLQEENKEKFEKSQDQVQRFPKK